MNNSRPRNVKTQTQKHDSLDSFLVSFLIKNSSSYVQHSIINYNTFLPIQQQRSAVSQLNRWKLTASANQILVLRNNFTWAEIRRNNRTWFYDARILALWLALPYIGRVLCRPGTVLEIQMTRGNAAIESTVKEYGQSGEFSKVEFQYFLQPWWSYDYQRVFLFILFIYYLLIHGYKKVKMLQIIILIIKATVKTFIKAST